VRAALPTTMIRGRSRLRRVERRAATRPLREQVRPLVSVVIPARNEQQNIEWVLQRLPDVHEVILVDGCSTDDTIAVARSLRPDGARVLVTLLRRRASQFPGRLHNAWEVPVPPVLSREAASLRRSGPVGGLRSVPDPATAPPRLTVVERDLSRVSSLRLAVEDDAALSAHVAGADAPPVTIAAHAGKHSDQPAWQELSA
jgi:Glycosyl transferase family 2